MSDEMTAGTANLEMGNSEKRIAISRRQAFQDGVRDGMPIALGYLAVSFTLGTAIQKAGMTAFQGMLASFLNNASAGEYVGFSLIAAGAAYWEMAMMTLITNARYLLMSCALSQKFAPGAALIHRLLVGYAVTDEIFGISIARPGYLNPFYNYGAMAVAMPGWAIGTWLGVVVGNILPLRAASALSVALYGMFLAVIIPPARKDRVVASLVMVSFAASFLAERLPFLSGISGGTRTILLTVVIAGVAAMMFPVAGDETAKKENDRHDA